MTKRKAGLHDAKLLHPAPSEIPDSLGALIEKKVAEALTTEAGALFEPFLQPRRIVAEFRKHQTVIEQRKWSYYFEEWGCLVCGQKVAGHLALGMCQTCLGRTRDRMIATLRRANAERPKQEEPQDLEALAQQALVPSIAVLAKKRRGRPTSKAWRLPASKSEPR